MWCTAGRRGAQFLIATLNQSGKFSALRYEFQGEEGKDGWGCRAVTTELATGERLTGPLITIGLAKKEGWYNKNGSKWQSMPELMLRYRAAAWFVRAYAPEIAMRLQTVEEVRDAVINVELGAPGDTLTLEALEASREEIAPQQEAPAEADAPREDQEAPAAPPKPGKAYGKKEGDPEAAPAPREPLTVICPDTGKPVDELDCASKPCRPGCPAFEF